MGVTDRLQRTFRIRWGRNLSGSGTKNVPGIDRINSICFCVELVI